MGDGTTADQAWANAFHEVNDFGASCAPRGMKIRELSHYAVKVDMRYPVVANPGRKINHRFMAAEAFWILSGDNRVDELTRYNPNMGKFSDDDKTLAGAYGPRIMPQAQYVVDRLLNDRDTRQATLTIWTPSPGPSKDIPCTIAMDFKIRQNMLHAHVFMRSSDVWLGLPYDIFSFSAVAMYILASFNAKADKPAGLGTLYLTAASSHLYEAHWAKEVRRPVLRDPGLPVPENIYATTSELLSTLKELRETTHGNELRWWETLP
jgi:thymidylate synthase